MSPTQNPAPVLYLVGAQKLGLTEGGLAQGTHSDWLCRRCQQPSGLPSQSGGWRRTQGGRAQGIPAPERSIRLPPGSGESGGQSRLGGCNACHPQSFSPKTIGTKSSEFFQERSTQSLSVCGLFSFLEKVEEAAQAISAPRRASGQQEKEGSGQHGYHL